MPERKTRLSVTGDALMEAFKDWSTKERRFKSIASGRRAYPESVVDAAARDVEDACSLIHSLLRRATGARRNQACAAVFPDGCVLVLLSGAASPIKEEGVNLELIRAGEVARLN